MDPRYPSKKICTKRRRMLGDKVELYCHIFTSFSCDTSLAGEYRGGGDYFDDYQYDYGYDYNSYVNKDDLLRYDYSSDYDYRQHGPAYNFSFHHPGQCHN